MGGSCKLCWYGGWAWPRAPGTRCIEIVSSVPILCMGEWAWPPPLAPARGAGPRAPGTRKGCGAPRPWHPQGTRGPAPGTRKGCHYMWRSLQVSGATAYISGTFMGLYNACLLCFPCFGCKLSYGVMIPMRFGVYARWFRSGYASSPECRGGKGETTWRDRRSSTGLCRCSARYRAGLVACQMRGLSTSGTRHVAPRWGKCLKIAIFGATGPTGV